MSKKVITVMMLAGFLGACFAVVAPVHLDAKGKPQTQCPVMGGAIDKSVYVDYQGKRVYFCCKGCPEEFKKNPKKYLKQMSDSGIELEKAPTAAKKK